MTNEMRKLGKSGLEASFNELDCMGMSHDCVSVADKKEQ